MVAAIPGRSVFGRGAIRGAGEVGSGNGGVVGRCSSMRSRKVGGTTRPEMGVATFGTSCAPGAAAMGDSVLVVKGSAVPTVTLAAASA